MNQYERFVDSQIEQFIIERHHKTLPVNPEVSGQIGNTLLLIQNKTAEQRFAIDWLLLHATSGTTDALISGLEKLIPQAQQCITKDHSPRMRLVAGEILYTSHMMSERREAEILEVSEEVYSSNESGVLEELIAKRMICRFGVNTDAIRSILNEAEDSNQIEYLQLLSDALDKLDIEEILDRTDRMEASKELDQFHSSNCAKMYERPIRILLSKIDSILEFHSQNPSEDTKREADTQLVNKAYKGVIKRFELLDQIPDSDQETAMALLLFTDFCITWRTEEEAIDALQQLLHICNNSNISLGIKRHARNLAEELDINPETGF